MGPNFFLPFIAEVQSALAMKTRKEKRGSITFHTDRAFEANKMFIIWLYTLGARGLHAPHPDDRPKAGKMSGLHEANEVSEMLVASDLWFQPLFLSQHLTLELSQRCDSWSNQFYIIIVTRDHDLFDILDCVSPKTTQNQNFR